jgi:hypothetical protein
LQGLFRNFLACKKNNAGVAFLPTFKFKEGYNEKTVQANMPWSNGSNGIFARFWLCSTKVLFS